MTFAFPDNPAAGPWLLALAGAIFVTLVVCVPLGIRLSRRFAATIAAALPPDFDSYQAMPWRLYRLEHGMALIAIGAALVLCLCILLSSLAGVSNGPFFYGALLLVPLPGISVLLQLSRKQCRLCGKPLAVYFREEPERETAERVHFCSHCRIRVP